jgi:predicted sulfurtransferase
MAYSIQVPATAFSRSFGKYRDEVYKAGVIEVTSHDRVVGAYISPKELDHFNELKKRERQAIHVSEADDDLIEAIKNARWGEVSE